ncbi:integral membrane protein GPR155-like, partial [Limulus polyphemus]|uniref:Integral membrane protein GPR155-like n=1 Tax=Limulus polyphemus TaxID=6850 RepID=A0ABM1RYL5_LIMPO
MEIKEMTEVCGIEEKLSSAIILCTALSIPVMYIAAVVTTLDVYWLTGYILKLRETMQWSSVVSLLASTCVIVVLLAGSRWRKQPHTNVFYLVVSQVILGSGVLFWVTFPSNSKWFNNLLTAWITYGQLASRIWTAVIAVVIVLHQRHSAERFGIPFLIFGFGMPVLATVGLFMLRNLFHFSWIGQDLPVFLYGKPE